MEDATRTFGRLAAAVLAGGMLLAATACSSDDGGVGGGGGTAVTETVTAAPPSDSGNPAPATGEPTATTGDAAGEPTAVNPDDYRSGGSNGGDVAFVSPSGNIWCRLGAEQYTAGCQAENAPIPAGADCAGSEMYPQDTLSRGFILGPDSVTPSCFNQGIFTSPEKRVLDYGSSVSANGYTCVSRVEGVTCTTGAGRGFVLSMQEARAF